MFIDVPPVAMNGNFLPLVPDVNDDDDGLGQTCSVANLLIKTRQEFRPLI